MMNIGQIENLEMDLYPRALDNENSLDCAQLKDKENKPARLSLHHTKMANTFGIRIMEKECHDNLLSKFRKVDSKMRITLKNQMNVTREVVTIGSIVMIPEAIKN